MAAPNTALVIVDMVNPLDFPRAGSLLRHALPAARRIARLRARLKPRGVPAIFVNDNFTHWREDFGQLVAICSQPGSRGAPLVEALPPEQDDYNLLKPQHSAFYIVASDCTASMTAARQRNALAVLRAMEARVMPCASIRA